MPKPSADYKTFPELAAYARRRAVISARRNGHQEFAYWLRIAQWASDFGDISPDKQLEYAKSGVAQAVAQGNFSLAAEHYAHAVHIRKMILNNGLPCRRLSLKWLREAAEAVQ